ncbi:hypothetical protein ACNOYE_29105, partial [Nannocystaceae bacterium ST9]
PAFIGRWRGVGIGERAAWKLTRRVRGFDAVLVADRREANEALELGLDRLYIVPLADVDAEIAKIREFVEVVRTGKRVPTGVHDVIA